MNIHTAHVDRITQLLRIGEEIESDLLQTKQGIIKTLVAYASREASEAMTALIDADPENPKEIRRLQNIIKRHQELPQWLNEVWRAHRDEAEKINQSDLRELTEMFKIPSSIDMENDE